MESVITFLREVRAELGKVTWPTRRQMVLYTSVVVGLCLVFALYLGGIDALATWLVGTFIVR